MKTELPLVFSNIATLVIISNLYNYKGKYSKSLILDFQSDTQLDVVLKEYKTPLRRIKTIYKLIKNLKAQYENTIPTNHI